MGGFIDDRAGRGAVKGAILDPSRYGKTVEEMGWSDLRKRIQIPHEEAFIELSIQERQSGDLLVIDFKFTPEVPGYHLEKASYRQSANPNEWNNWAMFYVGIESLGEIIRDLSRFLQPVGSTALFWKHELLPKGGGEEDTYYASLDRGCQGLAPKDYELCLGCWNYVMGYLIHERTNYAGMGLRTPEPDLGLKIRMDPSAPVRLKIGLAKTTEKRAQFMFKLATFSKATLSIQGVDRQGNPIKIDGKPRGRIEHCNHEPRTNKVVLDAAEFFKVAVGANTLFHGRSRWGLTIENTTCGGRQIRRPEWFMH